MNKKKHVNGKTNQGNSFVIVIATLSFLAVLTTALLVAVAVCYRMKAYDINSRDNFYYLEQAMDEIYEGVGSITMKHLNDAYNSVTDVIVVYDTEKKAYVTMSNEDANKLLNTLFIEKVHNDPSLNSDRFATIDSFITKTLSDGSSNGITLASVGNAVLSNNKDSFTIQQVVLKRTAKYSTVNSYKDSDKLAAPADYVQSITTDIVIAAPNFSVDFNSNDSDELYDYALISDMGIEIDGVNTKSIINGNIYAANDFYNKEYNDKKATNVTPYRAYKDEAKADNSNEIPSEYNGINEKSMYSGLYISKSKVSIIADKIIVPGSIAAMDSAELSIVGTGRITPRKSDGYYNKDEADSTTNHKLAQVWADNIVLGGYSKKVSSGYKGADVELAADTYISDDLELNATGSKYVLDGNYYGYSNATSNQRAYGKAYLSEVLNEEINDMSEVSFADGIYKKGDVTLNLPGQSHYNSSAIVVNGQHSELDLSQADSIYIAGQAYIEMSKDKKKGANSLRKTTETTDDEGNTSYSDTLDEDNLDKNGLTKEDVENAENNPYTFNDISDEDHSLYHETSEVDEDGNVTYNMEYSDDLDDHKRVEDYRTGESLSVKSNQLAYIPPYNIQDVDTTKAYVKWPKILQTDPYFGDLFDTLEHVPVVRTVVGGKDYFFYDFSETDVDLSEYITKYAELFYIDPYDNDIDAGTRSKGDLADLYDITNWEHFTVGSILVDDAQSNNDADGTYSYKKNIYTNGAISVKTDADQTLRVVGNSKKLAPLLKAKEDLELDASMSSTDESDTAQPIDALKLSNALKERYKSLRVLLTDNPTDATLKNNVTTAEETSITPINTYFNFSMLDNPSDTNLDIDFSGTSQTVGYDSDGNVTLVSGDANNPSVEGAVVLQSNYQIYSSRGDVVVKDIAGGNGKVMGVVICKGDVTFDKSVKEFHGLIVAGGKIKVKDNSINFIANREIVKAVLQECSNSPIVKLQRFALLFKSYSDKIASADPESSEILTSMKSVSSVEYEDVIGFNNWRKNVVEEVNSSENDENDD